MNKEELDLRLEYFQDVQDLTAKVAPHFQGAHSFVMMMVLADLIAQWLLSHEFAKHDALMMSLFKTADDRVDWIVGGEGEESVH